jgi:hypothetical protein
MLGLPDPPALDARPRVERVDDAPPEDVPHDRGRGNEEAPYARRRPNIGLARSRLAEQQPESRPGGTELSRRRHREVELQPILQQQHPVRGRPALEVDKPHRVELVDQRARPVVQHIRDLNLVGDTEGEVHVGEAIAGVDGERAHEGSGDDAPILLREP